MDNLIKYLGENYFYHRSHEFNANILDLHMKKGFFSNGCWDSFKKFIEVLTSKAKFRDTLTNREIRDKNLKLLRLKGL